MFEQKTPEDIERNVISRLMSELDTSEGSFTRDLIAPIALEIFRAREELGQTLDIAFPNENSGIYIDKRCAEYGILRKPGAKATAVLHFKGTDGAIIPKNKVFLTKENFEFTMLADCVIANGTASGTAEAMEIGTQYNVLAKEIYMQYVNLAGVTEITSEAATGGLEAESDADLMRRLDDFRKNPATSGNKNHYKMWAKETQGVGDAKVTGAAFGPGTVGILIVGQDKKPASAQTVAACAAHIEEMRPIGASVTVQTATALAINVAATVTIDSSVTIANVKAEFERKLNKYLQDIAFEQYTLLYTRISFILLDIKGVLDYVNLTVNGGIANVAIDAGQVPILGTVTF